MTLILTLALTLTLTLTSGTLYEDLLLDLDRLLATDTAFMLGPWLESARTLGGNAYTNICTSICEKHIQYI